MPRGRTIFASGTVWRGLYDGLGCPECVQSMPKTAQVIAETAGWLHARGLFEAMLQSFYDRFGGLSKLTKGWTGVYMADRVDGCAPEPRCLKYHGCHEA